MNVSGPKRQEFDVVVIGCGLAGMSVALGLAGMRVALVTKSRFGAGGASPLAQGGIAAAVGPSDSPSHHAADTLRAARGLAEFEVVHRMTRAAPAEVGRLVELGVRFDRSEDGRLTLGREAAHGRSRILHAAGDGSGAEIVRALAEKVAAHPSVEILESFFAEELIRDPDGGVTGVLLRRANGERLVVGAGAVVLASGGLGRLFACTTNPQEATADGLAMAARAGARLVDLEFIQFHPTALAVAADPLPLVTEALRGAGAVLLDSAGRRFMTALHPAAELAPRDLLARAIWERRQAGEEVFLDARPAAPVMERFPGVQRLCGEHGLNPDREPIPVTPAAHYAMGGVWTDDRGRTSVPGLWACGEVACTGVHGANRLASNSLLEAVVFGARVARDLARHALPAPRPGRSDPPTGEELDPESEQRLGGELRRLMWDNVGLVREGAGLAHALGRIETMERRLKRGSSELHNLLLAGRLVTRAALRRRESRGSHYRRDFPAPNEAWRRRLETTLRPTCPRWPAAASRPRRGVAP
jgi:L-aspartate oxidase